MTIIIPIITILIISVLVLLYIDFKESGTYLKFKNFDVETMAIRYDSDAENTVEIVKNIQLIARENNIILAKVNVDGKKKRNKCILICRKY